MLADCWISSRPMCAMLPLPEDANVTLSGPARAAASRSATDLIFDPAGTTIDAGVVTRLGSNGEAQQNIAGGLSLIDVAGGAMSQITQSLQDMRALAVAAANGTNGASDLQSLQQQFGQLSQECAGGRGANAFDGGQQFGQVGVVSLHMFAQLPVHVVELGGDRVHDRQDAGLGLRVGQREALALGHQHGDQLTSTRYQRGEFALLLIEQRTRLMTLRVQQSREATKHLRVDAIGLGQLAHAARKVACLARVDDRHAQARSSQRERQEPLMAARSLQKDQARCQRYQHLAQLGVARLVVAQTQGLLLAAGSHLEAGLGDIDAHVDRFTHSSSPAPSLMNTKCVRSTIRDAAEQRDHHRAPCAEVRARARRTPRLRGGQSTRSLIDALACTSTTEV